MIAKGISKNGGNMLHDDTFKVIGAIAILTVVIILGIGILVGKFILGS